MKAAEQLAYNEAKEIIYTEQEGIINSSAAGHIRLQGLLCLMLK